VVDWQAWVSMPDDWFEHCAWPIHFSQLLELTAHIVVSPDDKTSFAALQGVVSIKMFSTSITARLQTCWLCAVPESDTIPPLSRAKLVPITSRRHGCEPSTCLVRDGSLHS
jgi:hypothetical protein